MSQRAANRMRFFVFCSFAPAGPPIMPWYHPRTRNFDYLNIDHWVELAQAAERAKFDGFFWADHSSAHSRYQDSWRATVRSACQFPLGDPLLLAAALATSTRDLGFGCSANVIQDQPYVFARRMSTLDHLTRGRIAWNIVTSFQKSAYENLGYGDVQEHGNRYERADEYCRVIYKLLEGSWEDDAVVRDVDRRLFADDRKVHEIHHHGEWYDVPGIHTNEPSPQRVPFLFQAGSSSDGRDFATTHGEAVFVAAHSLRGYGAVIADMKERLVAKGRLPSDIQFIAHRNFVIGSTEEEARRKDAENLQWLSEEAELAFSSSTMDLDLATIDIDKPVGDFHTNALQGQFKTLAESVPDKTWTFRDVIQYGSRNRFVGTPEQIADEIAAMRDVGLNGVNVTHLGGIGEIHDFFDHVVPVVQRRGLMQTEYQPGTFREKMFAGTPSESGPRLNSRHAGAAYRHLAEPVA